MHVSAPAPGARRRVWVGAMAGASALASLAVVSLLGLFCKRIIFL